MSAPKIRTALVTGAAGSLGSAVSEHLAHAGNHVLMLDMAEKVSDLAAALTAKGLAATPVVVDVSREDLLAVALKQIQETHGGVDILVNIAGVSMRKSGQKVPVVDITLEDWNAIIAVNLTSAFLLTQEFVPGMVERKWGRVINMSSVAGRTGSRLNGAHYAATKTGLIGMTRTLALEVARHGVTANVIAPGRIETRINVAEGTDRDFIETYIPAGRLGTPTDVTGAVDYLVSDAASYVTGAILDVNGGWYMT